jgi:hypothetical protein
MPKLIFFKRLLSIKKIVLVNLGGGFIFCGGVPICSQVEGVLDGVTLG